MKPVYQDLTGDIEVEEVAWSRPRTKSMQEAAMERRKLQEEQKMEKRARDVLKRKEVATKKEMERKKKDADKIAQKQEKV